MVFVQSTPIPSQRERPFKDFKELTLYVFSKLLHIKAYFTLEPFIFNFDIHLTILEKKFEQLIMNLPQYLLLIKSLVYNLVQHYNTSKKTSYHPATINITKIK